MSPWTRARRFGRTLSLTQKSASALIRAEKSPQGRSRDFTHHIMRTWSSDVLKTLGIEVEDIGSPIEEPGLFVGNHMSYLDIPLLMSRVPVVFIAKKELAAWPVFGRAIRSAGMVFVDRSSAHSRKDAAEAVAPAIQQDGYSVAVFASGTTALHEEKPWRWGTFLIAKRYGIPLQPFRLSYHPARTVAYIDDDAFAPHLWNLLGASGLRARLEFGPVLRSIDDPREEAERWWKWAREGLLH